jgi:hypothetical protein
MLKSLLFWCFIHFRFFLFYELKLEYITLMLKMQVPGPFYSYRCASWHRFKRWVC